MHQILVTTRGVSKYRDKSIKLVHMNIQEFLANAAKPPVTLALITQYSKVT